MADRDKKGRFEPGHSVKSPGRPPGSVRGEYVERIKARLTDEKWDKIVDKAISDAIKGHTYARQWLSDYVIGRPPQTLNIRASEAVLLGEVLERMQNRGIPPSDVFNAMLAQLIDEEGHNGRG
jgi:hypothetical protein